jgi:hypothetical protein
VDSGNIAKPEKCQECGCTDKRIEGAHYDYGAALDVRWLCKSCHVKWDAEFPKGGAVRIELDKPIKNPYPKQRKAAVHAGSGRQFGES